MKRRLRCDLWYRPTRLFETRRYSRHERQEEKKEWKQFPLPAPHPLLPQPYGRCKQYLRDNAIMPDSLLRDPDILNLVNRVGRYVCIGSTVLLWELVKKVSLLTQVTITRIIGIYRLLIIFRRQLGFRRERRKRGNKKWKRERERDPIYVLYVVTSSVLYAEKLNNVCKSCCFLHRHQREKRARAKLERDRNRVSRLTKR